MARWSAEKKKGLFLLAGIVLLVFLWLKPESDDVKQKENQDFETGEEAEPEQVIRVLIKNSNYESELHERIEVLFEEEGTKSAGGSTENVAQGEMLIFTAETVQENVCLEGTALRLISVERNQGNPIYGEKLEIRRSGDGLVLIQEIPLETYIKGVLPSEMPSGYEKEALKAQAVCARTYAWAQIMEGYAYPEYEAHLDDSVSFQVYLNQPQNENTNLAVEETKGLILTQNGTPITAWYFSTSWGQTTDTDAWLTDDCGYLEAKKVSGITGEAVSVFKSGTLNGNGQTENGTEEQFRIWMNQTDEQDFEAGEAWYRWNAVIPLDENAEELYEKIVLCRNNDSSRVLIKEKENYAEGEIKKFNSIKKLEITERGNGGIVKALEITTDKQTILIKGQYNVRNILALEGMTVVKNDGTKAGNMKILPSGFFYIKDTENASAAELYGGGCGHGAGLSQNGANRMAQTGWSCEEILGFFYKDVSITALQEN